MVEIPAAWEARTEPIAVSATPNAIIARSPQRSCQRPTRNMNTPTAASIKNIISPVAPAPTPNIFCQKGAMAPGKPKVRAPEKNTARHEPMRARRGWFFSVKCSSVMQASTDHTCAFRSPIHKFQLQ